MVGYMCIVILVGLNYMNESEDKGMVDELKQWEYDKGYERGYKDATTMQKKARNNMRRKWLYRFVMFYRKWILRECAHFCAGCEFASECQSDVNWWVDLKTIHTRTRGKRV